MSGYIKIENPVSRNFGEITVTARSNTVRNIDGEQLNVLSIGWNNSIIVFFEHELSSLMHFITENFPSFNTVEEN